ncbi:MAG TPA: FKBP-type peptidyl-prolyl cis-trans isomerase [Chitinophagaceae bacterium]|nr:FKBP-type peptidyl-prolyl cis-trans isomerase [Chitinophagaceae bacterium]
MKKALVFTVFAVFTAIIFAACLKNVTNTVATGDCTPVAPSSEEAAIKAFCNKDTATYTKDTSYIYYHIVDSGSGPVAATTIFFKYKATLLDGTLLSQSTQPTSYPIVNLIKGFQDMARFYKKGARLFLVIPSALAYSCEGAVSNGTYVIPPNSILYYDIEITDVQ